MITPAAVASENATIPRIKMNNVWTVKNCSTDNLEPTDKPKERNRSKYQFINNKKEIR